MIRTRIRMFKDRLVVLVTEPTHPALAAPAHGLVGEGARFTRAGRAVESAVQELSARAAGDLLAEAPEPFRSVVG